MSSDIVERLVRADDFAVFTAGDGLPALRLMSETERRQEAADEIERLRAEVADWQRTVQAQESVAETLRAVVAEKHAEIERLRAEVNDLRNTHRAICALTWEITRQNPSHLSAWIDVRQMTTDEEEARRG